LNPFLATWRQRAAAKKLLVTPWPRTAKGWLGGAAYAQKFFAALAFTRPAATLSMNLKEEVGGRKARPHPNPLPRGEGDVVSASWPKAGAELALARGFNPRILKGAPLSSPLKIQADFITLKLDAQNLYPLLWSTRP
jgi:hypothetical protein